MSKITHQEIFEIIKPIIAESLNVDEEKITPKSYFIKDLHCDSLDQIELVMEFEKKFNIAIPDDDLEKISTVQNAVEAIERKL